MARFERAPGGATRGRPGAAPVVCERCAPAERIDFGVGPSQSRGVGMSPRRQRKPPGAAEASAKPADSRQLYRDYLARRGLHASRTRDEVVDLFLETTEHLG